MTRDVHEPSAAAPGVDVAADDGFFINRSGLWRRRLPQVFHLLRMNAAISVANVAVSVMLARTLGPEARGQVALLILWANIIGYVCLAGTHFHLSRVAAREPNAVRAIYATVRGVLALVVPLALSIFAGVAAVVVVTTNPGVSIAAWVLAGAIVPFGMWSAMQMQIELGRGNLVNWIAAQLTFTYLQAVGFGALWLLDRRCVSEYIAISLAAAVFSCVVTQWMVRRKLPSTKGSLRLPSPLAVLVAAHKDALATWLVLLTATADRLVVSIAFPAEVFGIYVVALALSHLQNLAVEAMAPLFFAKSARDHGVELQDHAPLAGRLRQTVFINGVAAIGLLAIAPVVLPLVYGVEYASGLALVYFMVPAFAMKAMMRPYEEVLRGADRAMQQSAASLGMVFVFALSAAVAVHLEWVGGIALSLLVSSLAGLFLVVRAVSVKTGLAMGELFLPRFHDATGLIAELVFHARRIAYGR
jgi:O-antigen/teichoic acid export membrane protein